MPPLLVYRSESGKCEQVVLKALPLGAVSNFPYASRSITLSAGDIVAMASDGLLEVFNDVLETFGVESIVKSLKNHAKEPAEEIIRELFEDGKSWGGEKPLADDLTIVVIKVTR